MTARVKKPGEKLEVSFVDIRSLCLHTPSMSDAVLKDLQRGLLRSYLKCLAKVIEQLLCYSTISSMRFSWRLPRNLYLLEERKIRLLYSSVKEKEQKIVQVPMKILDDLNICEQRAKLRAEPHLGGKPTEMQELGKKWWVKKRKLYAKITKSILTSIGIIHDVWLEHPLSLIYTGKSFEILLNGLADMIFFISIKCYENYLPCILLFEHTMYREELNIIDRVLAYASCLYNKYGLIVVPIISIVKDFDENVIDKMLIIENNNAIGLVKSLWYKLNRFEKLLTGEYKPKLAPQEICLQCDKELKRICPFQHR